MHYSPTHLSLPTCRWCNCMISIRRKPWPFFEYPFQRYPPFLLTQTASSRQDCKLEIAIAICQASWTPKYQRKHWSRRHTKETRQLFLSIPLFLLLVTVQCGRHPEYYNATMWDVLIWQLLVVQTTIFVGGLKHEELWGGGPQPIQLRTDGKYPSLYRTLLTMNQTSTGHSWLVRPSKWVVQILASSDLHHSADTKGETRKCAGAYCDKIKVLGGSTWIKANFSKKYIWGSSPSLPWQLAPSMLLALTQFIPQYIVWFVSSTFFHSAQFLRSWWWWLYILSCDEELYNPEAEGFYI